MMTKILTACIVVLVLVMYVSAQAANNGVNPTPVPKNVTTSHSGGFMVLPSILSLVLPAGLLAFLLHDLHC